MKPIIISGIHIIIYCCLSIWAALEGRREARRFYGYDYKTDPLHTEFALQRSIVGILIAAGFIGTIYPLFSSLALFALSLYFLLLWSLKQSIRIYLIHW